MNTVRKKARLAQARRERYARLYQAVCDETGDENRHEQVCAVIRLLETGSYP